MAHNDFVIWDEDVLRAGLEAAEQSGRVAHGAFGMSGIDDPMALLQELMNRGWVRVEQPVFDAGMVTAARGVHLTTEGASVLSEMRATAGPDRTMPDSPDVAWTKLRTHASPFSPFARAIDKAIGDLQQRGIYQSGIAIAKAMEVAYDYGLTWSSTEEAFVRREPDAAISSGREEVISPDPRKVFVVYGRDHEAKGALFSFLRALGLIPLEWEHLVALTGTGTPYIGDVLVRGFREAQAAVVLFSPDDEARLHPDLRGPDEPAHETELTCQPRPNVLVEAGMALALHPDRTVIAETGRIRPATDLSGRHVVHLGTSGSLLALATRLNTAGCPVDLTTEELTKDEVFAHLGAQKRQPAPAADASPGILPRGTLLTTDVAPAKAELSARLISRSNNNYLLEVRNRGGVPLTDVKWVFPPEARNWHVLANVLPEYPIARLDPRQHVRVPVAVSLGGPSVVRVDILGVDVDGGEYRTTAQLSVFD